MKQLLDSLNLKKVNVLGWSDGGNTGLLMAIHHKGYINKLAVMGSNAFSGEKAVDPQILKIFEERSRLNANKLDAQSVNQKRLADLVLTEPHITAQELQAIEVPTLVIAGENDIIKSEHTSFLHGNIKNSKMVILKGADHDAPIKSSAAFNKLVINFFQKN
jgi:pimeloyl-ACP methyl ester carboxylesterase